ncbi:MAG: hypothetical protein O7C75_04915 [Verrucomicrobia bacterium]|nr:hypothetical protein [Verrucomicrobiota bacterium]
MSPVFNVIKVVSFVLIALLCIEAYGKANRVAVKAKASNAYTLSRSLLESEKVQTYHLMEGRYFGGNTADASLNDITFLEIAEDLAHNLRRQNYYSEPDPNSGDLLIMVHYGVTDYEASYMELRGYDSLDDMGLENDSTNDEDFDDSEAFDNFAENYYDAQFMDQVERRSKVSKVKLLGMEDIYSRSISSQTAFEMGEMMAEERYFVFLTAFDLPLLRQGEKRVHWTTRYSVRAIGQPFDQSIKELNIVAGDFFGKNLKGLNSKRATDDSNVEVGEIEVIEQEVN